MRTARVLWLAWLPAVAACGSDPTLDVVVHHPMGVTVASTTITIYDSLSLTCDAVRFGDVDATELAGLAVAEETIYPKQPPQGALDNIPRADHKVVVARGLGNDGTLVAGGCVEQGEVTDSVTLTIDTVVAALASVTQDAGADGSDTYGVDVAVTDVTGVPLAGREVSWRVYGPAGTAPATMTGAVLAGSGATDPVWDRATVTCTGSDGVVNLHPVPPNLTSGYEVRPRVAWSQQPVAAYSTLTKTGAFLVRAPVADTAATHPCAIGRVAGASTPASAACIDGASVTVFHGSVAADGTVTTTTTGSVAVANPIGLFALPAASGSDIDILAVGSDLSIQSVFPAGTATPCGVCGTYDDIQFVPACGGAKALLLAHLANPPSAAKSIVQLDPTQAPAFARLSLFPVNLGKSIDPAATLTFDAAGCTTRLDATGTPTTVQVVVIDIQGPEVLGVTPAPVTRAMYDCAAGSGCSGITLPLGGAGAGFSSGATPALLVTSIDATGVELSERLILSTTSADGDESLVSLASVSSAGIPHRIAAGQLDADGIPDYVWDDAARRPLIQVAYAQPGPDGPLSAVFQSPVADVVDVAIGDVTGDGFDDVLLPSLLGVTILPTRVTPATGAIDADAAAGTCPMPLP